jgi:hypothetical protein
MLPGGQQFYRACTPRLATKDSEHPLKLASKHQHAAQRFVGSLPVARSPDRHRPASIAPPFGSTSAILSTRDCHNTLPLHLNLQLGESQHIFQMVTFFTELYYLQEEEKKRILRAK